MVSRPIRQIITDPIAESSTPTLSGGILKDATGAGIPAASLTALTLTIYDLQGGSYAIVNACDHVNIKNTGRGTVDVNGMLTIELEVGDTAVLDQTRVHNEHRLLLIEFTYGPGGTKVGRSEIEIRIQNMVRVP